MTPAIPARTFVPLAESPLATTLHPDTTYTDLAVRLTEHAPPAPATIARLLAITEPGTASRISDALDRREDLSPEVLALLVASRPGLRQATARLKACLFPGDGPGACHRFTRAIATLAHAPEAIDRAYLATSRFAESAGAADTGMLHRLLGPLLTAPGLSDAACDALTALATARHAASVPVTTFDTAVADAAARHHHTCTRAALDARCEQTITDIASRTGGLTLAAGLWLDELRAAATTPGHAVEAFSAARAAARLLDAGEEPAVPWPAARARWRQITVAARSETAHSSAWDRAWDKASSTPHGSTWDPAQRGLAAGYELMTTHVLSRYADADTPPTPDRCWATDPDGRELICTVADHLTGNLGHSPLTHFNDKLLIDFTRGLAKNRRDKTAGALQVHGLIAAVKAARSKAWLLDRPLRTSIGIVIPARGEARRIAPPAAGNPDGLDALAVKVAQLAWLLEAWPDACAEILLVDEDPDGASANAARQAAANHPQITVTIASRSEETSVKGGAVLWGLAQLLGAGHPVIAYTDLDLTYPLDQLGLLLAALDQPGAGAAIGSRRLQGSHGYYPPDGPDAVARLYQQAVSELLGLSVTDPQAGFKAFTAAAVRAALPQVTDHRLSFDTDLLTAVTGAGYAVIETGVAALHLYTNGRAGTPRDYDAMLRAVYEQAVRHGRDPAKRDTHLWDKIQAVGLAAAARSRSQVSVAIGPPPS